ncbi:MFS transporter [Actinoplanes sp. HUAS TT8]|uniref:MFS transporter n=1 Tax=Actinoplanes sp. HUAS TT8 TaxID=3447453 RepID=UPI003F52342E
MSIDRPGWVKSGVGHDAGDLRRLWAAYAVSQAGSGIGAGALPLAAILVLHVSDFQVSMLVAIAGIAGAAAIVPLGPWVEFHRKRPVMIGADLLRFAALLSIPVAALAGGLTYGQVCVVAAVQTVGTILSSAASASYVRSVVDPDRLAVINARWETTMWTASTGGPPLGGLLISAYGAFTVIAVDAISFLLSAVSLHRIRRPEPAPPIPADRRRRLAEMTAGWRHIAAHPVLRSLFVNAMWFGGCIIASTPLITILMLRDLGFTPAQYGFALGVPCAAGVVGSLLAPRIIARAGLMPTILVAGVARCLWLGVIPLAPASATGLAMIIGSDTALLLCAGVFNPAFTTYRMKVTADGYLARVTAAWGVSSKIVQPLMIAAGGVAAATLGARTALLALAGLLLVSIAFLPWKRSG